LFCHSRKIISAGACAHLSKPLSFGRGGGTQSEVTPKQKPDKRKQYLSFCFEMVSWGNNIAT